MRARLLTMIIVAGGLSLCPWPGGAAEPESPRQEIALSPELLELLRAEMREIAGAVQTIALSLATAEWKTIKDTSMQVRASYIMEKQLTPAQATELTQALPDGFKRLDADFHHRAQRLASAAETHDPEHAAFEYARLLESCTVCHAAYARTRFPGFAPAVQTDHGH